MSKLVTIILVLGIILTPVSRAFAELSDGEKALLVGAAIGALIWFASDDDDETAKELSDEAGHHMDAKEFRQAYYKCCKAYKITSDENIKSYCALVMKQAKELREVRGLSANFSCY